MQEMKYSLTLVLGAGLIAMVYAFWKSSWIDSQDEGTSKMKTICSFPDKGNVRLSDLIFSNNTSNSTHKKEFK